MKLSVFLLCLSLFHFSSVQCNELNDNNANTPSSDSSLHFHTNHIRTAEQLIKTTRSGDEERTQPLDGDIVETGQPPDTLTKRIEWDDEKTKEEPTPIQSKPTAVRRAEEEKREAKRKADEDEEKRMKVKREEETRYRFAEAPTLVKAQPGVPEAPLQATDSEETTPTARQFRWRVKAPPAVEELPVAVPRKGQLPELRVRTRMEQVPRFAKPPALLHRPAVEEESKPIESETDEEIQPDQLKKHRLTRLTPIYQAEHNKQARLVLHRPEPGEEVVAPTLGRVEQVPEAAKKRRVVAVRPEPVEEEIVRVRVERAAESPESGKKRRVRTMKPEPVEEPVEQPVEQPVEETAEEEVEKPLRRMLRVQPVERIEQLEEDAKEQPQYEEEPEEETRIRFRGTEPPTNATTPATNATQPTPPTPTPTTCPQIPSTPTCPEVRPCRCPACPQPFQQFQSLQPPFYPSKPAFAFPQTQPTTTTATTIPYQLPTQYQWPDYQLARQQNVRQLQHMSLYYQPRVSTAAWSRWTPRATSQFKPTRYVQPMF